MNFAIAFDFDGVIIDSIQCLKKTYYDFLNDFGFEGNESEFNSLNGPSLHEIISILSKTYSINIAHEELLERYKKKLKKAYSDAPLMDGALECLSFFKKEKIFVSLVTSSMRPEVDLLLKKHDISDFFDQIVTGDDVTNSKPSPEIYLKIKEKFPELSFWVVEDSRNGIIAANKAKMNVIFFDKDNTGTDIQVDKRINSLAQLKCLIDELKNNYIIIESSKKISISIIEEYNLKFSDDIEKKVERIWEDASKSQDLYDDSILYYHSHSSQNDRCIVQGFWAPYRYFFTKKFDPSLKISYIPLAVSSISFSQDKFYLIGKRKNVTEYNKCIEFAPSGGINDESISKGKVSYKKQIREEFIQELGMTKDVISTINEVGLIKDLDHDVIDICCIIDTTLSSLTNLKSSQEYDSPSWAHESELPLDKMIPTSLGLYNLYKQIRE